MSLARALVLGAVLLGLLAAAPAALADGDPASDYLLGRLDLPLAVRQPHPESGAGEADRDARERAEAGLPAEGGGDRDPVRPRLRAEPVQDSADLRALPRGGGLLLLEDRGARRHAPRLRDLQGEQAACGRQGPDREVEAPTKGNRAGVDDGGRRRGDEARGKTRAHACNDQHGGGGQLPSGRSAPRSPAGAVVLCLLGGGIWLLLRRRRTG